MQEVLPLEGKFIYDALHILGISVIYYDHLLTLSKEVHCIWLSPRGLRCTGIYWFLLNRYLAFFGNVVFVALNFYSLKADSCSAVGLFHQIFLGLSQYVVCALMAMRTYALYSRSRTVFGILAVLGMALTAVGIWGVTPLGDERYATWEDGCPIFVSGFKAFRLATFWETVFLFDLVVFLLTLRKSYQILYHNGNRLEGVPMTSVILRDGSLYFCAIITSNAANIITYYALQPQLKGALSTIASSISVTMMSRLTLNLREAAFGSTSAGEEFWGAPTECFEVEFKPGRIAKREENEAGENDDLNIEDAVGKT